MNESDIRIAVFLWLKERSSLNGGVFDREELASGFRYQGQVVTLIGATGIWFPKGFEIPISITTTTNGPYDDGFPEDDGLLKYAYRGRDPNLRDNVGLRRAWQTRTPLVYFYSIRPGRYEAVWPVIVVQDEPRNLRVRVAIEPAYEQAAISPGAESSLDVRRYVTALTRHRLHQSTFREFVLHAYACRCAICNLQHQELLDAAHIIPDTEPDGLPVVPNGLSLCKIHHAAYDQNILGISPDYVVKVRTDILEESDGPMLKYGLQSMEGRTLILPARRSEFPDPERLERRFERFLA